MPYRSALSQCLAVASAAEAPRSAQGLQRSTADTAAYCSILEVFAVQDSPSQQKTLCMNVRLLSDHA